MFTRLRSWFTAHESNLILGLLAVAVALRALLILDSPTPFGYVWDFYHDGVRILADEGRLPVAEDCWQCYHPPVFYLLGWPLFALGRALAGGDALALRLTAALSIPASAAVVYYGYRLLRLFGCRGASLVAGLALLFATPLLFISSYGAEADIVMSAFMSAFIFYFTRYAASPSVATTSEVAVIGALAGLAMATKYSGLLALVTAGLVFGGQLLLGPSRPRALRHGLIVLVVCLTVGGWKYRDNVHRYGTPLFANGSAADGLTVGEREPGGRYEFTTLRLGEVGALFGFSAPRGELTTFPVYQSVPTTLHALVWSDMSVFSNRSRHGAPDDPYPHKNIPVSLIMAVMVLGFVPEALAVLGMVVTIRRRVFAPLLVFVLLSLVAYLWWVIPQETWALKPKYVLFILPPLVVYAAVGLAWLVRRMPVAAVVAAAAMAGLVGLCNIYLYAFANGRL